MACNNPALQSSLMFLSSIYRNRILGLQDPDHESVSAELSLRSMRGLRDHLSLKLTPAEALAGVTTCLALTTCYIGENSSRHYNTHLYGALTIASQVLIPNKQFVPDLDSWFVFKWLTYCQVLVNINLLSVPERLVHAKAQNLPGMTRLYDWWDQHATEDPEYNLPVDSFYGFGTRLAPMLLQLNILVTRDAMVSLGHTDVIGASADEIRDLESALWLAHESSVMAKYSSVSIRKADVDLLHCDASFHGAALLYVYTYLKRGDDFSTTERIPHLVLSVITEVKAISPVCRTAAALLFVMYIAGSYAENEQRVFIVEHLQSMRLTCLSSVDSVLSALDLIWRLRDESRRNIFVNSGNGDGDGQQQQQLHQGQLLDMCVCHRRVVEAGINVCVY